MTNYCIEWVINDWIIAFTLHVKLAIVHVHPILASKSYL